MSFDFGGMMSGMGGMMGGMGGGGGNSTPSTTQTVRRSPWYEDAGREALGRATELADRPYEAYGGNRVAGLSQNEQQAGAMARGMDSAYEPYMARLRGGFSGANISNFMNPYVDAVLDNRKRGITTEFGNQNAAISRNQAATDAFRSGRSDLARARLNNSRMKALDEAEADTRAQAYESAKAAYFQQGAQDLGAVGAIQSGQNAQIGALQSTGAADRSVRQAEADFNYGQFLERRDWDVNNLNNLLSAIQAVEPTAGTKKDSGPAKDKGDSKWGGILGMVGTAIGAYYGNPQMGGAIGSSVGGMIDSDRAADKEADERKRDVGGF
jgi:hypothetical protein